MALTICPDCYHEVSDRAAACPRCGAPIAASPAPERVIIREYSSEGCFLQTMNAGCAGCFLVVVLIVFLVLYILGAPIPFL